MDGRPGAPRGSSPDRSPLGQHLPGVRALCRSSLPHCRRLQRPPASFLPVSLRVGSGELFDPLGIPALTGQDGYVKTCLAHNATAFTARDGIVAHRSLARFAKRL
eukprot:7873681-Alexandrium_andersonii.AAC.1